MIELDVTDPEHLAALPEALGEHVDRLDGVVHSIAFGNPETVLGGKFVGAPWPDVAQAVQVSAYSLMSLTQACAPMMSEGGAVVGMTFDATVAWPAYDWMGVAKAALESTSRYLARDLGPQGIRVNLVAAGPLKTLAAKAIPGFEDLEAMWGDRCAAGLGQHRPGPDGTHRGRDALGLLRRHDGRDRARRRRLPCHGGLRSADPGTSTPAGRRPVR